MANHGYITSKKFFKKDKIYSDLCEINKRRFNNLLHVDDLEEDTGENQGDWRIFYKNKEQQIDTDFHIWLISSSKLEHPHCWDNWGRYLEIVFAHEIAYKYNGMLSDDCCADKWKPEPLKYSSYQSYIDLNCGHVKERNIKSYNTCVDLYLECCPKEMLHM
jgi:hypothetical protein